MRNLHLIPTDSNIIATFCSDPIDRNIDAIRFCNIIDAMTESCVISLDGQWGSGKTFFVKQVKLILDYLNSNSNLSEDTRADIDAFWKQTPKIKEKLSVENVHATIYYDAWENDNDVDPILSLIYAVTRDTQVNFDILRKRDLGGILGSIADIATGRNIVDFFNAIKGEDTLKSIKEEKSIADLMKSFIDAAIIERGNRLIIFIDELDRCKPTFAVKMLERIKHFFFDDRVTFVFSVNIDVNDHTN